jgi:hypothetical protein
MSNGIRGTIIHRQEAGKLVLHPAGTETFNSLADGSLWRIKRRIHRAAWRRSKPSIVVAPAPRSARHTGNSANDVRRAVVVQAYRRALHLALLPRMAPLLRIRQSKHDSCSGLRLRLIL